MQSQLTEFSVLLSLDALLIKASGGHRDLLFQNLEQRLNAALLQRWRRAAAQAVRRAVAAVGSGETAIAAAVRNAFDGWHEGARSEIEAVSRDAYLEGKQAVLEQAQKRRARKAEDDLAFDIKPSFTLRDERAIGKLVDGQLHWVGEFYDDQMSGPIDEIIHQAMFETGLGRAAAAKLLEAELSRRLAASGVEIPAGFVNKPGAYFEVIAANTASNARVRGSLGQMAEIGVDKYTVSTAGDERTCDRCKHFDGKTITVKHATQIMEDIDAARTPEEVKRLHPWANKLADVQANPDRFPFPPYHGSCRCTVDVSEDAEISFEPHPGWEA